jgi:hypothetical protein
MPKYNGLKALIQGLNGLYKLSIDGLSIIYITAFRTRRQIDKAICRQIDKPYMPISPYHQRDGLSNLQNPTGYKDIPNTPSNRQTISSGYKGLEGLVNMA